ncbi:MAG: hypothetical protein LBJ90_06450 [Treponema sp.]|jgi:hypothetical protein|nr:hypothetical protein [Treponema sp.]
MSDPISLINGAITVITSIRNQFKKIDQTRFESIIAEMTRQLTEAQVEISALIQKNLDLEKENRKLLDDKEHPLVFDTKDGVYYGADDKDHSMPYCPHCYDADHLKIHLMSHEVCRHCRTSYKKMSDETKRWLSS